MFCGLYTLNKFFQFISPYFSSTRCVCVGGGVYENEHSINTSALIKSKNVLLLFHSIHSHFGFHSNIVAFILRFFSFISLLALYVALVALVLVY